MNIVLFDGICHLCSSTVIFLIKHDGNNNLHFAAQQTVAGENIFQKHLITSDKNSVVFIKGDTVYYKSDAIIQIAKMISGWPRILKFTTIIPKVFRDSLYDLIAKYRYHIFGKRANCFIPTQANLKKFL